MALDLQEQEELENAKRAWKAWGRWVFAALFVAALIYLGNIAWQNHVAAQNAKATDLLENEFLPKAAANNQADALKALQNLQQDYPKTVAAAQATLAAASTAYGQARYDEAAGHLTWLLANQKTPVIRALTIERLATVYLQQKKYDDALKVLGEKTEPEFTARLEALKGDVYLAQGKDEEARAAFAAALKQLSEDDPARELIEAKSKL